jgi:ABC-2 type transport system ATP-binding protein
VLILDEPTAGLDPIQIIEVRKLLSELRGKHTILLSTHILKEIEVVADSLVVIARGRIEAQGTPEELRKQVANAVQKNGWALRELTHETASLEQFFVQIMAKQDQAA